MNDENAHFQQVPIEPVKCLQDAGRLMGDQYWLFVGICLVGVLIGSAVPLGILMGPMMCGIYLCYLKRSRGERVTFEMLFKGFDYFIESLIATLIVVGIMLVVLIPLYLVMMVLMFASIGASGHGGPPDAPPAGFFAVFGLFYGLILLLSIAVGVFFIFVYPLIVDRGMKAVPALKTSFRAALANLGGALGLVLLNTLIGTLATLCCYVPVIFVLPVCFGAVFLAYRKVFPEPAVPVTR